MGGRELDLSDSGYVQVRAFVKMVMNAKVL